MVSDPTTKNKGRVDGFDKYNATGKTNARGIAHMMRVKLFRLVHVKTPTSQKQLMLLTARKLLQEKAIAIGGAIMSPWAALALTGRTRLVFSAPHQPRGTAVRDHTKDREILSNLNRDYVRSVDVADTAWFDANLASDFLNTNPGGTLIDRSAFIAQIGRGSSVKNIHEYDVIIRIFGDFAIIHAHTAYLKPDGNPGGGRYTDDWLFRDGRWQCISAHVARL